jgi:hypothetical protein
MPWHFPVLSCQLYVPYEILEDRQVGEVVRHVQARTKHLLAPAPCRTNKTRWISPRHVTSLPRLPKC